MRHARAAREHITRAHPGALRSAPKSTKIASTGEDRDTWILSMERELAAMKRKEVWDEVSELPIGTIPLLCMFIYKC